MPPEKAKLGLLTLQTFRFCAQNHLVETVHLSTHNGWSGCEIKKKNIYTPALKKRMHYGMGLSVRPYQSTVVGYAV